MGSTQVKLRLSKISLLAVRTGMTWDILCGTAAMGMSQSCHKDPMGTVFQGGSYAIPSLPSLCRTICKMLRLPECAVAWLKSEHLGGGGRMISLKSSSAAQLVQGQPELWDSNSKKKKNKEVFFHPVMMLSFCKIKPSKDLSVFPLKAN